MKSLISKILSCIIVTMIMTFSVVSLVKVKATDVTGTINFGSASGSTSINGASKTGDDSQGNTWTITTVGTTSFTPNSGYAQVGSSSKPATSITFTTTLSEAQTITAFSAKFGGFNGTAGTVTLKVGDTAVGSGSLNASNDVTVSSTTNTESGTVLTVTVTNIAKGVKCYYISYTYSESGGGGSSDPAITIASTSSNAFIGTSLSFTHEEENIAGTLEWHSSNESVATIEDGVLTPLTIGTTTITAKIGDVISNEKVIKVYKAGNSSIHEAPTISIADAIAMANLADPNSSPASYCLDGIVTAKTNSQFTFSDGVDQIMIYKSGGHGFENGDHVRAYGKLQMYQTNPELAATEVAKFVTVSFENDGAPYGESQTVFSGEKITEPVAPTKTGYSFTGWFNGNEQWDFDEDVVTSDMTLVAGWFNSSLQTIQTALNDFESMFNLAFSYHIVGDADVLTSGLFTATSQNYTDFNDVNVTSSAVYAGQTAKSSSNGIQLRSKNNNSGIVTTASGGKVSKVTVVWSDGNTANRRLNVYGKNSAYSAATDLYSTDAEVQGELLGSIVYDGVSTELVVTGDYEYIGLRSADGALYFDKITITWGEFEQTSSVKFKVGVDENLVLMDGIDDCGIQVYTTAKTKDYAFGDLEVDSVNGLVYQVIDLGDVLNNPDRATVVFNARAYVVVGSETLYSSQVKPYSVVTIVQHYLDNAKSLGLSDEQVAALNSFKDLIN